MFSSAASCCSQMKLTRSWVSEPQWVQLQCHMHGDDALFFWSYIYESWFLHCGSEVVRTSMAPSVHSCTAPGAKRHIGVLLVLYLPFTLLAMKRSPLWLKRSRSGYSNDWAFNGNVDGISNFFKKWFSCTWQICIGPLTAERQLVLVLVLDGWGDLPPQRKVIVPRHFFASSSCIVVCIMLSIVKPQWCLYEMMFKSPATQADYFALWKYQVLGMVRWN